MEVCEEHKTRLNDFMFFVLFSVLEQILIVTLFFLNCFVFFVVHWLLQLCIKMVRC